VIDTQTRERLKGMRLSGMVECLERLAEPGAPADLGPADVVKMAVDWEWERRRNGKLARLRRAAQLAQPSADLADIRLLPGRVIDTTLVATLGLGGYILKHEDVVLQGPTGVGKTYIACALGNKACQQYRKVLYLPAAELLDRLAVAERAGQRKRELDSLVKVDLLIIDDWFLTVPTRDQVQSLHTLIDRRHRAASTVFCTQLPPAEWHERMQEKILADAIIDRITSNAHNAVLGSDQSLRKHFNQLSENQPGA
jgi:DNA replication protein DnaC